MIRRSSRDEQLACIVDMLRRNLRKADDIAKRTHDDPLAVDGAFGYVYAYGYVTSCLRDALDVLDRRLGKEKVTRVDDK